MVHRLHHLDLVFGIVREHHLQRFQYSHTALGFVTKHLANAVLEHAHFDELVLLGNATALHKVAQRSRRVATPAHAGNRWHTRVVPAADYAVVDHYPELALARDRVGKVQARELDLARPMRRLQLVEKPVIQRPVILELQCAKRVRNVLVRIRKRVCKIIHRVDAPGVTGALVIDMPDAIQRRIAQVHIGGCHIDLRTQHVLTIGELTCTHAAEEIHILGDSAFTVRAVRAWLGQRPAMRANLLGAQRVHIGKPHLDQLLGSLVQLPEIVRRVRQAVAPVESQPVHILLNGVDVLLVFLVRIGVVITQEGAPARLGGDTEIQADRHDVADVQVAIRLRRKPGNDFAMLPGREVVMDDLADEVPRRFAHRFISLDLTGRYCTRSRGCA